MKVSPCQGGCWYCYRTDGELFYSCEWDAYAHPLCVINTLIADPCDREALIFANEFGLDYEQPAAIPIIECDGWRMEVQPVEKGHTELYIFQVGTGRPGPLTLSREQLAEVASQLNKYLHLENDDGPSL